jgi:predicted RND superfamily exporter protein
VDTGTEYGLTETDAFDNIRALSHEIEELPGVSAALSYADFVEEGFTALAPDHGVPDDPAEIGETLELLASRSEGFDIGSLVDPAYRRARILVRYDGSQGFARLRAGIAERCRDIAGEKRTAIVGYQEEAFLIDEAIRDGLGRGSLLFIPFLFVLLTTVFKSFRWGAVCMLPSVAAILAYLGAAGWLGIPLDAVTATGIAAVMGVGVDDAIHLLSTARSLAASGEAGEDPFARAADLAGSSIVQTTLTIFVGLAALFFSAYASVASAGLLSIIALGIGTLTTVSVVPLLGRRLSGNIIC